jgi:hypothetical protein
MPDLTATPLMLVLKNFPAFHIQESKWMMENRWRHFVLFVSEYGKYGNT